MSSPSQLYFLPGASGNLDFWQPVASQFNQKAKPIFFGWPGFGESPVNPSIISVADLTTHLLAQIDRSTVFIAQSMVVLLRHRLRYNVPI